MSSSPWAHPVSLHGSMSYTRPVLGGVESKVTSWELMTLRPGRTPFTGLYAVT